MPNATVSPDQDAVVAEIEIAAPQARVFEAITDPKQQAVWWGAEPSTDLRESRCSPTSAAAGAFTALDAMASK
jgi:uncharacterized protein YndB with AHSA1/START domain